MKRKIPIAILILLLTLLATLQIRRLLHNKSDNLLTVTFLDVGQGDSIVIRTPGGEAIVVDCGPAWEGDDAGRRTILPYLRSQSIQLLDALFLTHPDLDHIGGASSILRRVRVKRVFVGGDKWGVKEHPLLTRLTRERHLSLRRLECGKRIDLGRGVRLHVLNPVKGRQSTDNDDSLVLRVEYGKSSLLLTGDAGADTENEMTRKGLDLHSQIIKIAHHGSRFGCTDSFLKAVNPRVAIILVGKRNRFGHPSPVVLKRLEAMRTRIFRTDECGAIIAETDGKSWRIRTEMKPP